MTSIASRSPAARAANAAASDSAARRPASGSAPIAASTGGTAATAQENSTAPGSSLTSQWTDHECDFVTPWKRNDNRGSKEPRSGGEDNTRPLPAPLPLRSPSPVG